LNERESHFEALRKKAQQIENSLPGGGGGDGASSNDAISTTRSTSPLDPNLRQLETDRRALESRLVNVPSKISTGAIGARGAAGSNDSSSTTTTLLSTNGGGARGPAFIDNDRVSISSAQGVTLAMEVVETDTEQTSVNVSQNVTSDNRHRSHLQEQTDAMHAVATSIETVQSVAQLEASLKAIHQRLNDDRCLSYDNFSKQQDVLQVYS
jgi:hypothetical protein